MNTTVINPLEVDLLIALNCILGKQFMACKSNVTWYNKRNNDRTNFFWIRG